MIALVLSSVLSFFLFIVFGTFISKIAKFDTNFIEKILIGLVATNTITTLFSLFFPINFYILLILLACSAILVFFIKEELKFVFLMFETKKIIILYTLPFILIAFVISLNSPQNYDTGLYHLQSIKWIEEYSVVPGLANLHGRFGFNPNVFTLFALTSLFDIFKQEIFSVNFTLFLVFTLHYINKLHITIKQYGITNLFIFNLIIFITILSLSYDLSSPSPDYISITFSLFVFSRLFELGNFKKNIGLRSYIPILILCMYIVTVKLATLPLMLVPLFLFIKYKFEARKFLLILTLSGLIILPWLIRNIILTGWLIYPFYSLDLFDFDWKVPISELISMNEAITGWARSPGEKYIVAAHMNVYEWILLWWSYQFSTEKLLFLLSLITPLITLAGCLVKKIKLDFQIFIIIMSSFFGVIFWFFLAPDFRFGKTFIIISVISPLLWFNFKLYLRPNFKVIHIFFSIILILFILLVKINVGFHILKIVNENSNRIITPQIIEIPNNVNFKTVKIIGGKIYVPVKGDRCFNHCLPCASQSNIKLIFRGKTLQTGFKPI